MDGEESGPGFPHPHPISMNWGTVTISPTSSGGTFTPRLLSSAVSDNK